MAQPTVFVSPIQPTTAATSTTLGLRSAHHGGDDSGGESQEEIFIKFLQLSTQRQHVGRDVFVKHSRVFRAMRGGIAGGTWIVAAVNSASVFRTWSAIPEWPRAFVNNEAQLVKGAIYSDTVPLKLACVITVSPTSGKTSTTCSPFFDDPEFLKSVEHVAEAYNCECSHEVFGATTATSASSSASTSCSFFIKSSTSSSPVLISDIVCPALTSIFSTSQVGLPLFPEPWRRLPDKRGITHVVSGPASVDSKPLLYTTPLSTLHSDGGRTSSVTALTFTNGTSSLLPLTLGATGTAAPSVTLSGASFVYTGATAVAAPRLGAPPKRPRCDGSDDDDDADDASSGYDDDCFDAPPPNHVTKARLAAGRPPLVAGEPLRQHPPAVRGFLTAAPPPVLGDGVTVPAVISDEGITLFAAHDVKLFQLDVKGRRWREYGAGTVRITKKAPNVAPNTPPPDRPDLDRNPWGGVAETITAPTATNTTTTSVADATNPSLESAPRAAAARVVMRNRIGNVLLNCPLVVGVFTPGAGAPQGPKMASFSALNYVGTSSLQRNGKQSGGGVIGTYLLRWTGPLAVEQAAVFQAVAQVLLA